MRNTITDIKTSTGNICVKVHLFFFEKQEVDPVVETQSLTNPSEYLDDRTPLPNNILSGRKFYHLYCGRSSSEVVSFFEDFLLKSKVPHEVILVAHTSSSVQALYGFDAREINESVRSRLGKRRKLSMQQRFSHLSDSLDVKTKIAPLQEVWMFIRQFYRDLVVVEGVQQEAIRQIAHTTSVENTADETPRPRQQFQGVQTHQQPRRSVSSCSEWIQAT
jgi:hypothetical protein